MECGPDRNMVRICLYGGLRVSANEIDISPTSAKACGLIALLATHPHLKRSRIWLQDKLWSDRGRQQGAGSLRQSLVQIKKALGDHHHVLQSNRRDVWLEPSLVSIEEPVGEPEEFLQGLDVKDDEFEDWLRQQRQSTAHSTPPPIPTPSFNRLPKQELSVLVVRNNSQDSELGIIEDLFGDVFARCISETQPVSVFRDAMSDNQDLTVRVTAFRQNQKHYGIRANIEQPNNLSVWSNWCVVEAFGALPIEDFRVLGLANQLSMQVAHWFAMQSDMSFEERSGSLACLKGISAMYRFDAESLQAADTLFAEAYEFDPKGRYLAWRANLRVIEYVERLNRSPEESLDDGLELSRRAIEEEHDNSVVLALAADANLVFRRDVHTCDELSKRSIAVNSASPLGWWSQATAHLYGKRYEQANMLAQKARSLAGNTPHRFWWDFQCSLTAAATGKTSAAIRGAEITSAMSPNFKAPLRYLTALYARNEEMSKAREAAARLKSIEPDFSADRMANDAQYPVGLMRDNGFLDRDRIMNLD